MKLKYYLRGLGIGILVTTLVLAIAFAVKSKPMSDAEIIKRAEELGMVMEPKAEHNNGNKVEKNTEENKSEDKDSEENKSEENKSEDKNAEEKNTEKNNIEENIEQNNIEENNSEDRISEEDSIKENNAENSDSTSNEEAGTNDIYILTIERGQYARAVCENLAAEGIVPEAEAFRKYLQDTGRARSILAGNYAIPRGASFEEIANILFAGPM